MIIYDIPDNPPTMSAILHMHITKLITYLLIQKILLLLVFPPFPGSFSFIKIVLISIEKKPVKWTYAITVEKIFGR